MTRHEVFRKPVNDSKNNSAIAPFIQDQILNQSYIKIMIIHYILPAKDWKVQNYRKARFLCFCFHSFIETASLLRKAR